MNMQKVTIEVDMDLINGLRDRMKHIGFRTCSTDINNDCTQLVMDDADDAVLDLVKEFMNDFINAHYTGGQ